MKALRLAAAIAAMAAPVAPAAAMGGANPWPNGFPSGPPAPVHGGGMGGFHNGGGFHRGFGFPFFIYEQPQVVHDVVVVHDEPAEPPEPPPPPPPPREAWVLGKSYSSLPGGCMKMIQHGSSYYHCSGDWYRQVGGAYRAVDAPL